MFCLHYTICLRVTWVFHNGLRVFAHGGGGAVGREKICLHFPIRLRIAWVFHDGLGVFVQVAGVGGEALLAFLCRGWYLLCKWFSMFSCVFMRFHVFCCVLLFFCCFVFICFKLIITPLQSRTKHRSYRISLENWNDCFSWNTIVSLPMHPILWPLLWWPLWLLTSYTASWSMIHKLNKKNVTSWCMYIYRCTLRWFPP